jgi:TolA-binding protein
VRTTFLIAAAGLLALTSAAPAQRQPADSLLRAGREALNATDYRKAVAIFKQVVDKYPSTPQAGDALYWRAYTQYQTGIERNRKGDLEESLSALKEHQRAYAKSSLAADARDLQLRVQTELAKLGDSQAAQDVSRERNSLGAAQGCGGDEEMKIAALDGLMQMDAASAVPILSKVLQNRAACTENLRKHAVFVLSQKRGDDATTLLLSTARSDPSAEVRADAVQWLGQVRSERAAIALDSILFSSSDHDTRDKALFALSQQRTARAGQSLRRFADDERMPNDLRGQAVFWLGDSRLGDLEFYRTLFKKSKADEIRGQIFQAVSNLRTPDAAKWMIDIARDKTIDTESRSNAIFWSSQSRTVNLDDLATLYAQSRGEDEIQDKILFAYSQRNEPAAVDKLIAVATNDPNREMKKKAIFWLGQKKNDPRAIEFLTKLVSP